jgi:hypothetical protein
MGRLIQTISVPPGSVAYHAIEDMKRLGKNVSHVICSIIGSHYELYDEVENLRQVNSELRRVLSLNREAIDSAGCYTAQIKDDFGHGPCIALRLRRKDTGMNVFFPDPEVWREEE